MILIVLNILLALAYAALTEPSLHNLVVGFVLGLVILAFMPQLPSPRSIPLPEINSGRKLVRFTWNVAVYLYDFFKDLTLSSFQIAWDALTPTDYFTPDMVRVPVGDLSDIQVYFLATRITLTPGTLSVDVTEDRQWLVVHVMYAQGGDIAAKLRRPIDILTKGL